MGIELKNASCVRAPSRNSEVLALSSWALECEQPCSQRPLDDALDFIRKNIHGLSHLVVAITGAERAPSFVSRVMEIQHRRAALVAAFTSADLPKGYELRPEVQILYKAALRVSKNQAVTLTEGYLDESEAFSVLEKTDGALINFLAGVGTQDRPLDMPNGRAEDFNPERLLLGFLGGHEWVEALEVAAVHLPHKVPQVLTEAGHVYHEQGLHNRLWQLLSNLPANTAANEMVLVWRLAAAVRLGKTRDLREAIEDHLSRHEASELRAMYAATLRKPDVRCAEAKRAATTLRSPLTLFQYGRLEVDLKKGLSVLKEAVDLAEERGRPYEVVRNAGALAAQLIHLGQYKNAAYWSNYALTVFKQSELHDNQRYSQLANDYLYSHVLTGKNLDARRFIGQAAQEMKTLNPDLSRLLLSTLGDLELALGNFKKALQHYYANWESTPRYLTGKAALDLTRALVEDERYDEAQEVANQARALTKDEALRYRVPADLALGVVLAFKDKERAETLLLNVLGSDPHVAPANYQAVASLYLAQILYRRGDVKDAKGVLKANQGVLQDLAPSGLRLLSGPAKDFEPVWQLLLPTSGLKIVLLGRLEIMLDGETIAIPPQWGEILCILALANADQGITLERLMLELYGDSGDKKNLKATLSKMRRVLPISQHPYRITSTYTSDVQELASYLDDGRLEDALKLYRGPILPTSDAPAVRKARDVTDQSLRHAFVTSGRPQHILKLAELFDQDLGLWELAERRLEPKDGRLSRVAAHIKHLREDWGT